MTAPTWRGRSISYNNCPADNPIQFRGRSGGMAGYAGSGAIGGNGGIGGFAVIGGMTPNRAAPRWKRAIEFGLTGPDRRNALPHLRSGHALSLHQQGHRIENGLRLHYGVVKDDAHVADRTTVADAQ